MNKIRAKLKGKVHEDISSLDKIHVKLLKSAHKATKSAYAPYSNFFVGASILLENGKTFKGANFENASYPLCLCAERVVLAAAHACQPDKVIKVIAVTAKNESKKLTQPVSPCGACRQVLVEVEQKQNHPLKVILQGEEGPIYVFDSASELLPLGFGGDLL